jgi:segregation and condensation protein B
MADIEKKRKNSKRGIDHSTDTSNDTSGEAEVDNEAMEDGDDGAKASLRDLVNSASAAFDLFDESGEAEPRPAPSAVEKIEWSAEGLDIITEGAQAAQAAQTEDVSKFEELARRVADTVSTRDGEPKKTKKKKSGKSSAASEAIAAAALAAESSDEVEAIDQVASETEVEPVLAESSEIEEAFGTIVDETQGEISPEESVEATSFEAATAVVDGNGEVDDIDDIDEEDDEEEQMGFTTLADAQAVLEAPTLEGAAVEAELAPEPELETDGAADDADPEPTEFVESDQLVSIIESLLFSTDKPVSVTTIKQLFKGTNIRTKDITRALDELASEYASPLRGVTLEDINGGFQLRSKVDNAEFLRRLTKTRPFRLSGPALETMAIIAYKQPVTKHEIDEIRGVESGHLIRALMERGLACFNGKAENMPGKPMAYGTTRKFLETFGLRNLKELPTLSEIDEILPEGIGEVEEKETLSDLTESLSTEITSTYSEGEDELLKINEQLAAVDTTSEFFEQEKQRERERRDHERAQDIRERIVLGDAVEDKDRRWLDRYEAKLNAPAAAEGETAANAGGEGAEGSVDGSVEGSVEGSVDRSAEGGAENAQPGDLSKQLEGLTAEGAVAAANMNDDEELTEVDAALMDDEDLDELAVNGDWDDDDEPEAENR